MKETTTGKGYIYSEQMALFGDPTVIGFSKGDLWVKEIDRNTANETIIKNHYSHKFYNASYIHLGIFKETGMVGVLQFGYAMNPASCGSVVDGTEMDQYLELNRMWIADNAGKYPESRAISSAIKYIRKRYPSVKWIQSFADERCKCFGIVYQACSFGYYGEHDAIFWTLDGEIYHNSLMTRNPKLSKAAERLQANSERATSETLRQFRYIKFMDRSWASRCLLQEKPYPKHYKEGE